MLWFRKMNEARALEREFTEPEPSYDEARILQDGSSLDKKPEEDKEEIISGGEATSD